MHHSTTAISTRTIKQKSHQQYYHHHKPQLQLQQRQQLQQQQHYRSSSTQIKTTRTKSIQSAQSQPCSHQITLKRAISTTTTASSITSSTTSPTTSPIPFPTFKTNNSISNPNTNKNNNKHVSFSFLHFTNNNQLQPQLHLLPLLHNIPRRQKHHNASQSHLSSFTATTTSLLLTRDAITTSPTPSFLDIVDLATTTTTTSPTLSLDSALARAAIDSQQHNTNNTNTNTINNNSPIIELQMATLLECERLLKESQDKLDDFNLQREQLHHQQHQQQDNQPIQEEQLILNKRKSLLEEQLKANKASFPDDDDNDEYRCSWVRYRLTSLNKTTIMCCHHTHTWFTLFNNSNWGFPYWFTSDSKAGLLPTKDSGHKIYLSSPHILDGDWVQIFGEGVDPVINPKTITVGHFLDHKKPHPDTQGIRDDDYFKGESYTYNYTIDIKWE